MAFPWLHQVQLLRLLGREMFRVVYPYIINYMHLIDVYTKPKFLVQDQ